MKNNLVRGHWFSKLRWEMKSLMKILDSTCKNVNVMRSLLGAEGCRVYLELDELKDVCMYLSIIYNSM